MGDSENLLIASERSMECLKNYLAIVRSLQNEAIENLKNTSKEIIEKNRNNESQDRFEEIEQSLEAFYEAVKLYQISIDKKITVLDEMNALESKYLEKQDIEEEVLDQEHINHKRISGNEEVSVRKEIKRHKEIPTENINSRSYKRVNHYCNKKRPLTKYSYYGREYESFFYRYCDRNYDF